MFKTFLGIDISKDSFDIALLDSNSQVKLSKKLSMDKNGFNELFSSLKDYDKDEILIAMEATGIYHLSLLSFLLDNDFKYAVINPMLVKNFIASSTLRKTKNDKKDSSSIALFALKSQSLLRLSDKNAISSISILVKEREKLAKQIALLKTEIKANLVQLFPEMLKNINVFTKSILNLLLKAPSACAIGGFEQKNIDKILFDIKAGSPIRITSSEILALANSSIGIYNPYLEKVLTSKIRRLLNTYDELKY